MPTYVIIDKRDFESLFETVDSNGTELTAINVKTSDTSKKRPRLPLRGSGGTKDKQGRSSRTSCSSKDQSQSGPKTWDNDPGTTKCVGTYTRTTTNTTPNTTPKYNPSNTTPSTCNRYTTTGSKSDSESDTGTGDRTRVCRSAGIDYTDSSDSD